MRTLAKRIQVNVTVEEEFCGARCQVDLNPGLVNALGKLTAVTTTTNHTPEGRSLRVLQQSRVVGAKIIKAFHSQRFVIA